MYAMPRTLPPRVTASLAAVPLIAATTLILFVLQRALIHSEGEYIRANTAGFLLTVGLLAAWGGRRVGLASLLLSVAATVYFLMPPHFKFVGKLASDWIALGFQCLAGGLLVEAIYTAKRNRHLHRAAEARARQERLINDIGHAIRASPDPDEIEASASRHLQDALQADLAFFAASEPEGEGAAETKTQAVVDGQAAGLERNTPCRAGELPVRAWIAAPIGSQGQLVAAMIGGPRLWTPVEIALAEAVALQARTALEAARTLQREQRIATILQEALQPTLPAAVRGLDVDYHYKAALEEAAIGGDFYDVFPLSPETSALVIGDVSGKGLAAAAQIAMVRNMLRYALYQGQPPGEALTHLNRTLEEHGLLPGFVTLFAAIFHAPSRVLTYVSCGHEPVLLRSAESGEVEELGATGPVLGVIPGAQYRQCTETLGPGDALLLYTDGASEAGPDRRRQFGVEGLTRLLREMPPCETAAGLTIRVADGVRRHAENALHDDLCLVAVTVQGRGVT